MGQISRAITYRNQTFRTSVSVYRGEWMTVVTQDMRDGGLTPSATYSVDIAVDSAPRTVEVPDDLRTTIGTAGLTDRWEALSFTHRKEHVRSVNEAKKPETRARRVDAVIAKLSD